MAKRTAPPAARTPAARRGAGSAPRTPAAAKKAVAPVRKTAATETRRATVRDAEAVPPRRVAESRAERTPAQRDRRFNLLLHTACLKAGTAAAFSSITARVPLLGRLAPVLLGSIGNAVSLPAIQKQLVRDVLDIYALELSDAEQRGVVLLATGAELGAQMLSDQMVEQILAQFGAGYLRLVGARMLPLASVASDIAAAIATTYTVGKRAQVLCNLPGTGARNLGELLRGLTAIDQRRLFAWSAEALRLALRPFRSVLLSLRPGA
ncbi:hypothetical protein [Chiayiivirga flava]|uniref:Uncharacterized protein (DUF697 family) n=1 Tax=Chiayiivirga flava TaxID=659595 RepID=A0A7W8D7T2_9GAMM|nr:hypothetical protein [Chiayiivirga flava]MBB5208350.1 uncharacterized protein (DUF697 family) [Chiayiivirga flava]